MEGLGAAIFNMPNSNFGLVAGIQEDVAAGQVSMDHAIPVQVSHCYSHVMGNVDLLMVGYICLLVTTSRN